MAKTTFIFSIYDSKRLLSRGNNKGFRIYKIEKNAPVQLGVCEVHTGSYKGNEHAVHDWLIENGHIKKPIYRNNDFTQKNAYHEFNNGKYDIVEV